MIQIQRILCPTDFSSESDEALRYAVALARAYHTKLTLLHCVESTNAKAMRKLSHKKCAAVFEPSLAVHLGLAEFRELDWEGVIVESREDVGRAITREAAERQIDLIVIRSRRRPHAALLLGSTAETVCRTAPCPVLVTHPGQREWVALSTGDIDLQRILIAYDFSSDSELGLNYGISLAQEHQTELHLLHVLSRPEPQEPELLWSKPPESNYTVAASKLQRAIPQQTFLWCKVVNAVRWGKAYQEVLAYAKEHDIDLICMGASGSDFGVGAFFGSNVDRVLRQAPCPVLVARPLKPADSVTSRVIAGVISNKERNHDPTKVLHRSPSISGNGAHILQDRTERP